MFEPSHRMLAIFSHPNHEVSIYGILHRSRAKVMFLTDGGGGDRLAQTKKGLENLGTSYLDCTEDSFYRAILRKDTAFFDAVALRMAAVIRDLQPTKILCDAVEYYNPIHDIALPLTLLAARRAACSDLRLISQVQIFAVPLVYQNEGPSESYVFQRSLPGQRFLEQSFELEPEEGRDKRRALENQYAALMSQMRFPPEVIDQACRTEYVVPARSPLDVVDPSCAIRYDRRGSEAKKGGFVDENITYDGHFIPLVRELLSL